MPSCVTHVEPSWDPEPLEFAFNTNPSITTSSTKNPAIATRMNLMSVLGKERRGDGDAPLTWPPAGAPGNGVPQPGVGAGRGGGTERGGGAARGGVGAGRGGGTVPDCLGGGPGA